MKRNKLYGSALLCVTAMLALFVVPSAAGAEPLQLAIEWFDGVTGHVDGGVAVATAAAAGAIPAEVKAAVDEVKEEIQAELKTYREKLLEEALTAAQGIEMSAELKAEFVKRDTAIDLLETKANEAFNARFDELEATIGRVGSEVKDGVVLTAEEIAYKDARDVYFRTDNKDGLAALEQKALQTNIDTAGGFSVLPQTERAMIKTLAEISNFRAHMGQTQTGTDSYEQPVRTGRGASGWTGETETRSETDAPTIGMLSVPIHEIYAKPTTTQKMLDDSFFNVEQWMADEAVEEFGYQEGVAFAGGDGVKRPKGFLTYTNGTTWDTVEQIDSGHATLVQPGTLMDLVGALKDQFLTGARFFMSRGTKWAVRKIRADSYEADDGQGAFLWQPTLEPGTSGTLLGYPVTQAEDMPAVGAGALSIAFGNFREGYLIVDRMGIRTLRDPYSTKGYVEFYTTKRVGGGVRNGEAIKLYKISA